VFGKIENLQSGVADFAIQPERTVGTAARPGGSELFRKPLICDLAHWHIDIPGTISPTSWFQVFICNSRLELSFKKWRIASNSVTL
jgi:hypothetical protein